LTRGLLAFAKNAPAGFGGRKIRNPRGIAYYLITVRHGLLIFSCIPCPAVPEPAEESLSKGTFFSLESGFLTPSFSPFPTSMNWLFSPYCSNIPCCPVGNRGKDADISFRYRRSV